jgi:hypothetical protein
VLFTAKMENLDKAQFEQLWRQAGEDQTDHFVETAWRRYNQIHRKQSHYDDSSIDQLKAAFEPLLDKVRDNVQAVKYLSLDAKRPPWVATHLHLTAGQEVSVFATGRIWRSRVLDLWLGPQFGMWYRLGENGTVFNSTEATNTFKADYDGNFYLGTQYPGQFGDKTGLVKSPLRVYEKADGGFNVVVIVWKVNPFRALREMHKSGDPHGLLSKEVKRQDVPALTPKNWHFFWSYGISDHFISEPHSICCRPDGKAGILQRPLVLPFTPSTTLAWDWLLTSLPSRLREDTTFTHDYLSVAVEFENGIDITYYWSYELPVGFGYWCHLAGWQDREFHVVVRSGEGEGEMGQWLSERRDVYADYERYIGGLVPERIVRVWLIAGSRWQRNLGEVRWRNMKVVSGESGSVDVI